MDTIRSPELLAPVRADHGGHASRSGKIIVVVVIAAVLALAMTASADAGTYVIDNCPSAPTGNGNPGPWTVFGAPQNTKGSCSGGPGSWIGPEGGSMPPIGAGDLDGVRVTVPAGSAITIREAHVWWFVPHQISGATTYALAADNIGEPEGQVVTGALNDNVFVLPSTTTELTLADYCSNSDAGYGCTFGEGENPNLELFGASLTLFDSGLPSGSVTGGGLAGAGPVSGTQSLAYDAEDTGSGVRLAELLVDGQAVAKNDYIAECPYQNFAACPTNVSSLIGWNSESVGDGTHELALRIVNAAGNATIVDSHTISIENPNAAPTGGIIGPGSPAAERGPVNGTNASDQAKLTASWAGTAKEVRTSRYGATDRITGRLMSAAGQPISGASLDVSETPAYEGAGTTHIANVGTDATGAWTLTLPKTISSSVLRFAYSSHVNDTIPVATATLTLRVHAGIALRISPRVTSVGRTIHFSGTLHGAPIPPGGKQLVLEASSGAEWIQFDTIRTDAKGRFHASYRFKFPGSVTYRFRVLSTYEAGFPFLANASDVVDVFER